jgi:hypothetical protein
MKKLLLLLLFSSLSSLNAMRQVTVRNTTGYDMVEIDSNGNKLTIQPQESKQLHCPDSDTEIRITDPCRENTPSTCISLGKETTLLTIDAVHTVNKVIPTTQKKTRPLIIYNSTKRALLLAIHRPGYGIWQEEIACPAETDFAVNTAADADRVDISLLPSGPNLFAKLDENLLGVSVWYDDRLEDGIYSYGAHATI